MSWCRSPSESTYGLDYKRATSQFLKINGKKYLSAKVNERAVSLVTENKP